MKGDRRGKASGCVELHRDESKNTALNKSLLDLSSKKVTF